MCKYLTKQLLLYRPSLVRSHPLIGQHLERADLQEVAGKVRPLVVVLEEVREEGGEVKVLAQQVARPLGHEAVGEAEVVVEREGVQVNEEAEAVALVDEARGLKPENTIIPREPS